MTDREAQYIKETGDKKPRRSDFENAAEYYVATIDWYESFSTWLSAQLEKAEKENIQEFIKNVVEWNKKNFGEHHQTGYRLLLGCQEELGELSHAHLKGEQNIRHTPKEILKLKKDAIGDLFVFLVNYCDSQNINFLECCGIVWKELQTRDWIKKKEK